MMEESRGLAAEKSSWKPTKLPATTVNSLVSITHLKTGDREGDTHGQVQSTDCQSPGAGAEEEAPCVVHPVHEEKEKERNKLKMWAV